MLRSNPQPDLDADAIGRMFCVTPSTVRRWATKTEHHDACPHRKDGRGRLRFDPVQVDEWLTTTVVLKRSQAQRPAPAPGPAVEIFDAIRWTPQDVTTAHDDHDIHALHRTLAVCLHVCRHSPDLPDPPALDIRDPDQREAAVVFLLALDRRSADEWKAIATDAIDRAGQDSFLEAIHA